MSTISIYTAEEQFHIDLAREYSQAAALHQRLQTYTPSQHGSIEAKNEMLHHSSLRLHRLLKQFNITFLN